MIWAGIRYCFSALAFSIAGKVVGIAAEKTMQEAPDLIGVGRFHVHIKIQTKDGVVEKTARFPWLWLARLFIQLETKRHLNKKPEKVVYKTKHAVVTC